MAYALDIPVYGVPSMDALALAARDAGFEEELVTICDARRGEVYWARNGTGENSPVAGPKKDREETLHTCSTLTCCYAELSPDTESTVCSVADNYHLHETIA